MGILLTFSFAFISLTPLVLLPTMLEQLRGFDTVTVGMMLVPEGVIELIGLLLVAPFIGRIDSRALISSGFLLFAAGAWMMTNYNFAIGYWDIIIPLGMQGAAMSIIWLPVFHMLYSTLKSELHNEAAAMVGLAYSISSSAGIAISVTLVSRTSQTSTQELVTHVIPTNKILRYPGVRRLEPRCGGKPGFHSSRGGGASADDRLCKCLLATDHSLPGGGRGSRDIWNERPSTHLLSGLGEGNIPGIVGVIASGAAVRGRGMQELQTSM